MIRRILSSNVSILKQRLICSSLFHSDSIDGNLPDEQPLEELRLSSQEATGILRMHEASIDLEANCPVKYYEVNYLGANNPPGQLLIQMKIFRSRFHSLSRGSASSSSHSFT